jgi:hypothetical protein
MKRLVIDQDKKMLLSTIVSNDVRKYDEDEKLYLDWVEKIYYEENIELINFQNEFTEKYQQTGELPHFNKDLHFNATGYKWVAERIFGYIDKSNLIALRKK